MQPKIKTPFPKLAPKRKKNKTKTKQNKRMRMRESVCGEETLNKT
jgi:hypothetical protein